MKLLKIVPILALFLVLSVTAVMAAHTAEVSMKPNEWSASMDKDVSLNVKNTGADNIIMVELMVPEKDQTPLYLIKEISRPQGWVFKERIRTGQAYPYKITWTTAGAGIASDESLGFGFTAQSPEEMVEYNWNWITTDAKGGSQSGTLKTSVILAPVAYFKIKVPGEATAGNSFQITVTAYDSFDKVKTDYTGTVSISSTDAKAILPEDYTFKVADKGFKELSVKLKTGGSQKVSVEDTKNKISKTSDPITVNAGSLVSLTIAPDGLTVNAGETVVFSATANDLFGNKVDVTNKTNWNIDGEAAGEWTDNMYKTENKGIWTVSGTYNTLKNGVTLNVGEAAPPVEVPIEEEVTIEEEVPEEEVPPVAPITELAIECDDSIYIPAGENDTMVLTVNNEGDTELTGVGISFTGVPSDWISIFPLTSDIDVEDSKDYLVIIYVPENETESQTITFTASSNEGATAEKNVTLSLEAAPTGFLEAIPKNILQLGVVIIAVAAVVIIGWELWFKK